MYRTTIEPQKRCLSTGKEGRGEQGEGVGTEGYMCIKFEEVG